jgi:hypothetical protein
MYLKLDVAEVMETPRVRQSLRRRSPFFERLAEHPVDHRRPGVIRRTS